MVFTINTMEFISKYHERNNRYPFGTILQERTAPDLKLKYAVQKVLDDNSITNRNELDHWVKLNGGTRTAPNGFYKKVKDISQTHWSKLKVPEMSCTAAYEKILPGYKQCAHGDDARAVREGARLNQQRTEVPVATTLGEEESYPLRWDFQRRGWVEKFSDIESLVPHSDFGSGPIRHLAPNGKFYHGLNNHSHPDELPGNPRWSNVGKLLHCHLAPPPRRAGGTLSAKARPQWDHEPDAPLDHPFCTNHEKPNDLNARRTVQTVFRCLGH